MKVPLPGISGLAGGVCFLFQSVAFAMTHGSTTVNRNESWLGIDAVDFGKLLFIAPLLFFFALLGYEESFAKVGRIGRFGLRLAQASCLLQSVSFVLQTSVVDPLTEWRSPIVIGGWLLYLLTVVLFSVGMSVSGAALAFRRTPARTEGMLFLAIGLCTFAAQLAELWISRQSDGSLMWNIAIAAKHFPAGLSWIALSVMTLSSRATFSRP